MHPTSPSLVRWSLASALAVLLPTVAAADTLILDFSNGKVTGDRRVRKGHPATLHVRNVNRFLYDVTIAGKSVSFNEKTPALFTSKLLPSAQSKPTAPTVNAAPPNAPDFESALEIFNENADRLLLTTTLDEDLRAIAAAHTRLDKKRITEIRLQSEKTVNDLLGDSVPGTIAKSRIPQFTAVSRSFRELQRKFRSLTSPTEDQRKLFDAATERFDAIGTAQTSGDLEKEFSTAEAVYVAILREDAFEALATMSDARGDEVTFEYDIKAKEGVTNPVDPKKDQVAFTVTDFIKLDFSTGVVFSKLVDREYRSVEVTRGGNTVNVVRSGGDKNLTTNLGALLHVYWKKDAPVQPALSFGASLNADQVQYLGGLSLLLGRQRRAVLTFGLAGGHVQRLATSLRVGGDIPAGTTDLTRSRFTTAPFFAFTYNFD